MLITCKCLNIIVEAKENDLRDRESEWLKLSSVEELESFFKEDIREAEIVCTTKQINSLVEGRTIGMWRVEQCLNCSVNCYATNVNNKAALINASLITNAETVKQMKTHRDFSLVFRVIVQPNAEEKQFDTCVRHTSGKVQNDLTRLQQILRESIREEVTKTEERIRAYSEEQYMKLEDFRNRATKDHVALTNKIYEVQVPFHSRGSEFPPGSEMENDSRRIDNIENPINPRLGSSKKPAIISPSVTHENEFKARTIARPISSYPRVSEKIPGSLDSEGLFVLEGMEDNVTNDAAACHSEGESDTDHEDSGSHDEGIDVHRKRIPSCQMAKSLPVNVPVYSAPPSDVEKEDEPSDAVDIAASIKALARSVHGDTVFGDLPRPRFSTQI